MSEVRISTEDYETWEIATPDFNANFNSALKEQIPTPHRWWSSEGKVWVVSHEWKERAVALAQHYYGTVVEVEP